MQGVMSLPYGYSGLGANSAADKFLDENGYVQEMDVEELRDHLEGMDPNDPPLMPGQYVLMLNREHET